MQVCRTEAWLQVQKCVALSRLPGSAQHRFCCLAIKTYVLCLPWLLRETTSTCVRAHISRHQCMCQPILYPHPSTAVGTILLPNQHPPYSACSAVNSEHLRRATTLLAVYRRTRALHYQNCPLLSGSDSPEAHATCA